MSRKQPTFALSLLLLSCLSLLFLLLVQLGDNPAAGHVKASSADEQDPFALIKTIVVNGTERDRADPPDATILQAGISGGARSGMMLYVGDEVTTGRNVKLTILFLDKPAEKDNEVVIDSKTHVQLGSLFTWGGRVLASVKGYFETKTTRARWSVQGTEYELVVNDDGTNRLRVLKGAVRVDTGSFVPTIAENEEDDRLQVRSIFLPAAFREPGTSPQRRPLEFVAVSGSVTNVERDFILTNSCQRLHVFQVKKPINLDWFQFLGADQFSIEGRGTRTIKFSIKLDATNVPVGSQESQIAFPCLDCNTDPGCGIGGLFLPIIVNVIGNSPTPTPTATARPTASITESAGSNVAVRMEEIMLPPAGRLQKSPASVQEVDETLNWSNEVIIPSEPSYSAQSVVPRFRTEEERNLVFREARRSSIVNDDRQSKENLADVYVDWGNGAKAEEELKRLGLSSQETPERLTTLGEAYRLMGDLRTAEQLLKRATSLDPTWASAFNALGNVYLDQAKVAQDQNHPTVARDFLEKAKTEYAKALQAQHPSTPDDLNHAQARPRVAASAGKTETVAQSNLGEVHLRLGEIARDQSEGDEALREYQAAEQAFGNAAKIDQNYQFAYNGLGDVYRDTGEMLKASGDDANANRNFTKSQDHYAHAVRLHNDMAEAYVGLGRVLDDTGDHDEALKHYLKATQVRAELPDPHYYLAVALAPVDPQRAAEEARAYLKIEREVLKHGEKAKTAEDVGEHRPVPVRTVTPTTTPTSTPTPTPTPTPSPSAIASPLVQVPHVNGDSPEKALKKMREKGLEGETQEQADCKVNGKVLGTSPGRDQKVPKGSKVTIFISGPGENAVTMPLFKKGTDQESAEEQLRQLNLPTEVKTRETDRWPPHTVMGQEPEGGKRLPSGCTVKLTVAIPIPPVTVPRYVDRNLREISLPSDGLSLGNVTEVESNLPGGSIISQSREPGEVVPRGTAIDLVVSIDMVIVPEVGNLSPQDAAQKLRNAGLKPEEVVKPGPQSYVVKQDPQAGARVRRGTRVRLWFGIVD